MKEIPLPQATLQWCERALLAKNDKLVMATPLRVEASNRHFYRIATNRDAWVLMESPPALERNDQFVQMAQIFFDRGIPVPEIVAQDKARGLFLMSDLGDTHLEDVYGSPEQDAALRAAIDMLPIIAATSHPAIEPYTGERLVMELDIYRVWFLQELLGLAPEPAAFAAACEPLIVSAQMQPKGCVHRDYHCRNLLFGNASLGVVDFQDALHGPVLYDIASLLRDCYYEFDEPEIDRWLHYFINLMPVLEDRDIAQIKQWFDWIAVQRQLKAVGIFARLHLRDAKSSHLPHILPVMERLIRLTGSYSELASLNLQLTDCIKIARSKLEKRS